MTLTRESELAAHGFFWEEGLHFPLTRKELKALIARRESLVSELKLLLVPKDPNDEKNVVLEIRAGTGGDEAALFAAELFRMYSRYAARQEVRSCSTGRVGPSIRSAALSWARWWA